MTEQTWPQDITIDNYCKLYEQYHFIVVDIIYSLQRQLIMRLTEKEKKDFFTYLYRRQHNYNNSKIRRPSVWVKIDNCLPLRALFCYSDDTKCQTLYKKLKRGNRAVLEFPFSKVDIIDDINKLKDWTFVEYELHYHLVGRRTK